PARGGRLADVLSIQDKRIDLVHELHARKLTPAHARTLVVNVRHLGAEPADVDRTIVEHLRAFKIVDHREHFLRFTESEYRNEDAAALIERGVDRVTQTFFFARARPAGRRGMIASRAFPDQDVDLVVRKLRSLHDG